MISCICCKNCEKRYIGCHSTCDEYITYRAAKDEENEKIRKLKYAEFECVAAHKKRHKHF
jgi:hypothetical protein